MKALRLFVFVAVVVLVNASLRRPGPPVPAASDLAALEARAAQLATVDNIAQRQQVHVLYELAAAYRARGRLSEAHATLTRALSVDPRNADGQLEAAQIEIALGRLDDAHERLGAILAGEAPGQALARARALEETLRQRGFRPRAAAAPAMTRFTIAFAGFAGTDSGMVKQVAERVGQSFGVKTRVLEVAPEPAATGRRESRHAPGGVQHDADALVGQLEGLARATLAEPDVIGVVGVHAGDLYAPGLNFLFGSAKDRVGVLGLARFATPGAPREAVLARATKQALSTAGFVLGVPRCSSSSCARAYPHSLDEFDRKGHALCADCLRGIDSKLGR